MAEDLIWHKVLDNPEQLAEGRVMTVSAGHHTYALTHFEGKYCALDNKCPHQGGPLGEGSIENGLLRCPWHGWDYHPCTGKVPDYDDGVATYPTEQREDGIYIGVPPEPAPARTISDVMVETMVNWGVDTVFGMVGHSNLGMADAMRKAEKQGKLRFFGIRHEGAASFAASGYAKLSGRPAACFAIAGPGSTNMYTGLWDAKVDRMPILALTGQVKTQVTGTGFFQEVDLKAAFQSVARWSAVVQRESKHAELMNQALRHALLERDVTHLVFPDEVQELPAPEKAKAGGPEGRMTPMAVGPPADMLQQAMDRLKGSQRPVIIVGHGARYHMEGIIALAEALHCPVLTTFKGKGLIPDNHPLGCGVLGRSGTPIASYFMNEADTLLVFGASFSNHTGITPKLFTIQVDFDPLALSKFHKIDVPVLGDIGVTCDLLLQELASQTHTHDQRPEIADRWRIWRAEKDRRTKDDHGNGVGAAAIFAAMTRHTPSNAVVAVDVGNNAYSFGRYFECQAQSVLMSGYLGSIGFAYPAAMGAWAAAPDRPIVAVSGDGGFGQYMGELTTAVKYNMPIKHILLNNNELGKISKEQRAAEFDVWATSLHNPNFSEFAKLCGAWSRRVTDPAELDEAMKELYAHDGPAMLEIMQDVSLI